MTHSRCPKCGYEWDYRGTSPGYVTCPGCYRKVSRDACTVYPALVDEVEARVCELVDTLGLPATAVARKRGKGGDEVVVRLPPEGSE